MIAVLQKARWAAFALGFILIAIGGFGLLTNAPWGVTFSSISTIFGTSMSFAQMFVAFPTTTIGLPKAIGHDAPPVQRPPAQPPGYTPGQQPYYAQQQPYAPQQQPYYPQQAQQPYVPPQQYPYYTPAPPPLPGVTPYYAAPIPTQSQFKSFRRSAIALWIGAFFTLIQLPIVISLNMAAQNGQATADTLAALDSFYSLAVVQGICYLCALRGVHAKHAQPAGVIGLVAILVIGGAWILSTLAGCIVAGNYIPGQPFHQDTVNQVLAFTNIDNFFIIAGDILLGISFIYGRVYPTWIGIIAIALGFVNIIALLIQQSGPAGQSASLGIFVVGTCAAILENAATGWVLFKKPYPVLA